MKYLISILTILAVACSVRIKGTVNDAANSQPISNATIHLNGVRKTTTDNLGVFETKITKKELSSKPLMETSAIGYNPDRQQLVTKSPRVLLYGLPDVPVPPAACNMQQKIDALPPVVELPRPRGRQIIKTHPDENIPLNNVFVIKKSQDVLLEKNLDAYILFNPNGEVIWPGALVTRSSVDAGSPALINVPRKNINIWINNLNNSTTAANNVTPNGANVTDALNKIVLSNPTGYGAAMTYEETNIFSQEQSALEVGVSAKWAGGSASATFSKSTDNEYNAVAVKFMQVYYTANIDPPSGGNVDFFQNMSPEVCDRVFNPQDPPCYISSVNYGRMMFFKIESKSSAIEIKAALTASYKAVSIDAAVESINRLKETKITAYIKGGSPEDGLNAITAQKFAEYIMSNPRPSQASPGVPISFVVKDIKNNSLVSLQVSTQFTEYSTTPLKRKVRIELDHLKIWNDGDNVGAGEFIWKVAANNQTLNEQGSLNDGEEVSLSTGKEYSFNNQSIDLDLPYTLSEKVVFKADFTEKDGGLNGNNDVIPTMVDEFFVKDFSQDGQAIERSIRKSKNGDPDVELFYRYRMIGTFPAF